MWSCFPAVRKNQAACLLSLVIWSYLLSWYHPEQSYLLCSVIVDNCGLDFETSSEREGKVGGLDDFCLAVQIWG